MIVMSEDISGWSWILFDARDVDQPEFRDERCEFSSCIAAQEVGAFAYWS